MKALILNGSLDNDLTGERIYLALKEKLGNRGWKIDHILLSKRKIHNCNGDFFCWIKHPGTCMYNDDNRDIARTLVQADLLVYLTPITFGGYSFTLKRFVDNQIQNISPFFTKLNRETHHKPRYAKYPNLLGVGWLEEPDPQGEAVFQNLVYRNSHNFYAKKAVSDIVYTNQADSELQTSVERWLERLGNMNPISISDPPKMTMLNNSEAKQTTNPIKKALLLVGSPRNYKSTSNSLGEYFLSELSKYGIETELLYVHKLIESSYKQEKLISAVNKADLVILAFPLYVDTLPAPVIKALEIIASERKCKTIENEQLFISIANCGFPESHHNANAIAISKIFSQKARFRWAGSLSLGGGEMIHGVPLKQLDSRTVPVRKALELAAKAVSHGNSIPEEAQRIMAKPVIPTWLYRFFG